MLHHADFVKDFYLTSNNFIRHTYLMVDLFFVLSGFVIAYNYSDRIKSLKDLLKFQKRRFFRLYPLHFVTLLIMACLNLLKEYDLGRLATTHTPYAFMQHLFLTQALSVNELTFNKPSWSISTEFYTYLAYALVLLLPLRKSLYPIIYILGIAGLGVILYSEDAGNAKNGLAILRCFYSFMMGVMIWYFARKQTKKLPASLVVVVTLGSFVAVGFGGSLPDQIFPLIFTALIYSLAWMPDGRFSNILCNPRLVLLGTLSYSIYMWHNIVWWVIRQTGYRLPMLETYFNDVGKKQLVLSPTAGFIVIVAGLVVTLIISYFSYYWIEAKYRLGPHSSNLDQPEALKESA